MNNPPVFKFEWSAKRMLEVSEKVFIHWDSKVKELRAHIERLGGAVDERYLGARKKLERKLAQANAGRLSAKLHLAEVMHSVENKAYRDWSVSSDQLPWFFPQEIPEQDE